MKSIIIFGGPGAGDTTLGKELARQLNFQHFDLDDYLWSFDTVIPFTVTRPREERIKNLMDDISKYPCFVMSGSMYSIREYFTSMFKLAVFIETPVSTRIKRVNAREFARFGDRILAGGDMYIQHQNFIEEVKRYDTDSKVNNIKQHEQWITEFTCPVLRVDGTVDISENTSWIINQIKKMPDFQ